MNYVALAIGLLAALAGIAAAGAEDLRGLNLRFDSFLEDKNSHDQGTHQHSSSGQEYALGSAHSHALFYVVVNGTEIDFKEPRYQLAERYVHLENNRSHIVHSHAESVTWNDFLDSINVSYSRGEELCVKAENSTYCGEGDVWYNGEVNASLNSTIEQGDKLIIAIGPNHEEEISRYRSRQLPKDYVPERRRGKRL